MSALLALGTTLASGYFAHRQNQKNADAQNQMNAENRQHQWNMYWQQREHAVQDWNAQNAYNHPSQQMERLRQAGLNPNLVYGKGAENAAAMARSSSASPQNGQAPRYDFTGQMNAAMNFINQMNAVYQGKQIQAQTDNLHEQNRLLGIEGLLKQAQVYKTMADTDKTKWDMEQGKGLYADILENLKLTGRNLSKDLEKKDADIENVEADTEVKKQDKQLKAAQRLYTIEQTKYTEQMTALTLEKIATENLEQAKREKEYEYLESTLIVELENLRKVLQNHENKAKLDQYLIELNQQGIGVNSPFYAQMVAKFIRQILGL